MTSSPILWALRIAAALLALAICAPLIYLALLTWWCAVVYLLNR